jgi:N-methylhydantoinase B
VAREDKPMTGETRAPSDINLEILRRKLLAIADEMAVQLRQTAQVAEINQERDYATGIIDRSGAVVVTDNAMHLGALSATAHSLVNHFRFDMKEGDVVVTNDLDFGGTRAVDLTFLSPLFALGSNVLYLAVRARMPDLGGMVAGGICPTASEQFSEGVPLTPMKLLREGRIVRDIMATVLLNSRHPDSMRLTFDAMIACMDTGRRRIGELIGNYGLEQIREALDYSIRYVERRTRAQIKSWAEGVYEAEAHLDHNGSGTESVAVRVAATVEGETLTLDFTTSAPQAPTFINSTLSNTTGCIACALLSILGDDIPPNEGVLRAVAIRCELGKITNATSTAATGWSAIHCGGQIIEATARALRQAASALHGDVATPQTLLFARPETDRGARIALDAWGMAGSSACHELDGWGRPAVFSRTVLPSIEEWELGKSIKVRGLEFARDTAGCGEWRGAPAVEAVIELPQGYVYTICRQGMRFTAEGAAGGGPGSASVLSIGNDDQPGKDAPAVAVEERLSGKVLRLRPGSGAGYGDPHDRDPLAVIADVLDDIVSRSAAESQYGVVLSEDGKSLDLPATTARRARDRR